MSRGSRAYIGCVCNILLPAIAAAASRSLAKVTSAKNPFITRGPLGASCLLRFLEDAFFSGGGAGAFGVSTLSTSNTTKGSSCDADRATCVVTVSRVMKGFLADVTLAR